MLYQPKYHLPSPPFVEVEGILNFRDLGGYPVQSPHNNHQDQRPRSVRRGLLFRCADPSRVTPSGMRKLQSLGITTIFDLRSASEAMKDVKSIEEEGSRIHRVSVPIFAQDDESPMGSPSSSRSPVASDEDASDDGMLKGILRNASPCRETVGSRARRANPLEYEKHEDVHVVRPAVVRTSSSKKQYAEEAMARAKEGIAKKPEKHKEQEGQEEAETNGAIEDGREPSTPTTPKPSAAYKRCAAHMSSGIEHGYTSAYHEILLSAPPALRTILQHLLSHPSDPIILHCSLGRDRTGVVVAIILSLLGVPDECIAREYQLTEVGLGTMKDGVVEGCLGREKGLEQRKREIPKGPQRREVEEEEEGHMAMAMGARKEHVLDVLEMVKKEFGGAEGYVKGQCGVEEWEVEQLKGSLVVECAPIHFVGG